MFAHPPGPVLVLAPHTDDAEFGCGGTISKLVSLGVNVSIVVFSSCSNLDTDENRYSESLKAEMHSAVTILGLPTSSVRLFDYPVRSFDRYRQQILDEMIMIRESINPSTVFLPSSHDTHQDHEVIRAEGFRAFKMCTLLGYELPWNNIEFTTGLFVSLSEDHLEAKINSIAAYNSQKTRFYSSPPALRAMASFRGLQINTSYAEAFEAVRIIHS